MKEFKLFEQDIESFAGINLIEASAGTGKTFTLSLLVLRLIIEKGYLLEEIVAVTFTKAATAELKGRIGLFIQQSFSYLTGSNSCEVDGVIRDYLDSIKESKRTVSRDEAISRLEQALLSVDKSSVFTIHSFCQRLLKEFAFESGSELGRELIDSSGTYIEQATMDFWRKEILLLNREEFEIVVGKHKNIDTLYASVRSSLAFSHIEVEGKVEEKPNISSTIDAYKEALKSIKEEYYRLKDAAKEEFLAHYRAGNLNGSTYRSEESIEKKFSAFEDFIELHSYTLKSFTDLAYSSIKAKKGKDKPEHTLFHLIEENGELISELNEKITHQKELLNRYILSTYLSDLDSSLTSMKEKHNESDFNDIIRDVYRAVSEENPKKELFVNQCRNKYKVALVDEFQDTDKEQFTIFNEIFGASSFFMIGDPKQAIYRFRGGDVYAYLAAKNREGVTQYTLNRNFRSEESLIENLNIIFHQPRDVNNENPFITDGIDYHTISAGSDREQIERNGTVVPSVVLWKLDKPIQQKVRNKAQTVEIINKKIVSQIIDIMNGEYSIGSPGKRKKATAGDCAILVRSNREAKKLKETLNRFAIPAVISRSGSIFASEEALFLHALLQRLENVQEIKKIRSLLFNPPFSYSLQKIDEEIYDFIALLIEVRNMWLEEGILPALNYFFERCDIYSNYLSDGFTGYRPLTNLRQLVELLHQKESEVGISPIRLIHYLTQEMRESSESEEKLQRLESDESAVQIMTIHSSKGLEFPIVFVPYPWDLSDSTIKGFPIYYKENEIFLDIRDENEQERAVRESNEEYQRLFYVALTRASQQLFIGYTEKWNKNGPSDTVNPAFRFLKNLVDNPIESIAVEDIDDTTTIPHLQSEEQEYELEDIAEFVGAVHLGKESRSYSSVVRPHSYHAKDFGEPEEGSIFAFPKGAMVGNAWHKIFEEIDYTIEDEKVLEERIVSIMKSEGFSDDREFLTPVIKMVQDTLTVTFDYHSGKEFQLQQLSPSDKLAELEFYLRSDTISLQRVAEIIQEKEGREVAIKNGRFDGFLQGFIDLFFKVNGQYFILDWKSNHLGNGVENYTFDNLNNAMIENEYHLQYTLYSVALLALLKQSDPDFDYDKDFGGVYYIFLRGIHENGNEGVFYNKPKRETIEALLDYFHSEEA